METATAASTSAAMCMPTSHHERYIHAAFPALLPQTLKIIRYASRLVVALSPPDSERRARFDALQSSVGTSRQAGPC